MLAAVLDVRRAMAELSTEDVAFLEAGASGDGEEVGRLCEITPDSSGPAVPPAVGPAARSLNGEGAPRRRRALSNAATQAQTRNAYDG